MSLLRQCSTLKAVDKQGYISAAYSKAELHGRKVMLCVWYDHHNIIHFEFLNCNQTLNADLYSQQVQCVHVNLLRKRPALVSRRDIVLFHDNTRLHSARITQRRILDLNWSVLPHPPYSPDLASSDFHLFPS